MDNVNISLQQATIQLLQNYIDFLGEDQNTQSQLVIDLEHDHYLLIETGWENTRRIYGTLIHIDIIDQKIWIQHDGTEEGVAYELLRLGISHKQIVLAYKSIERRKITEFAVG